MALIGEMTRKAPLVPEGFSLRRYVVQGAGLALFVAAVLLALALATYSSADPSWDNAVDAPVLNALGPAGARLSDALLQGLGLGAWLLPPILFDWAVRLLLGRGLQPLWLRLAVLPPMLAAAALALSIFPAPSRWPVAAGLGGAAGRLGKTALDAANLAPPLAAMAAAGLVGLMLFYVMGFSLAAAARVLAVGEPAAGPARPGRIARLRARIADWRKAAAAIDANLPLRREPHLDAPAAAADAAPEAAPEAEDAPAPRRAAAVDLPQRARRRADPARQASLDLRKAGEHLLPPLELLREVPPAKAAAINEESLQQNARLLESVLEDFGVRGQIVKVRPGPVVTLYELEPAPGIKASRVIGLADDIARSMSAISARVAVVPGRNVIGIELPNQRTEMVYLRELLASESYERGTARLPLVLGKDISGAPVVADLARMPHLLIAGTTGSGKSVGINTMILSILHRLPPGECKFIMIDPKMLELSVYDGIPHLLAPVVTEPRKAVVALKWTVREMENRYRAMSKLGVRNIEGYNQRLAEAAAKGEALLRRIQTGFDDDGRPVFEEQPLDTDPLPLIIVVVDEMADLMLVAGKDIEAAIQRLAQMARAAGIHIIMATQRPSVDVITGTIKANFPTRISFQVTSKIDSRTILGEAGAEQLLGRGDMLHMAGGGRITRVHGPFVSDEEVEAVVRFLKENGGEPTYLDEVTEDDAEGAAAFVGEDEASGSGDALYDQAVALVCRERKASTSFVQRHLQIGYNRAARIIERMEGEGVVSGANHVGKREVLARKLD
ncbi:MAG TPA: DNA translocase FtsK 4TM domain-containing protein [Stellaceae bacterium]|nr:DNA translocase FtsK 4TM domain-containing protein [Stellaceae bacterium]